MSGGDGPVRPVVVIGTAGSAPDRILREVQAGLEEEGVPFDVHPYEQTDPCALAHQAARDSPLDVGLGVSGDGLCVHHAKLPRDRPVCSEPVGEPGAARRVGHDAARVVTGVPLKLSDTSSESDPPTGAP